MKRLRIGVIGCANIAGRSVIPAIKNLPEFELAAIASRDLAKAREFSAEFGGDALAGYEKIIERDDIDAVYIPLPTGLHHEWICKALNANKHVLAEKSLALNLASAQEMCDLARRKKLVLMEDFMFQYHSQHKEIRKLIDDGEIGEIRLFRSSFGFPALPPDNFRYRAELGGGALLDCGAYTLKASSFFTGEAVKVSSAQLVIDEARGIDLYGSASLISESGIACQVAWGFEQFYQCKYEIWGSAGRITATRAFTPRPDFSPLIILEKQGECQEIQARPDNHFENILSAFACRCFENDYEKEIEMVLCQAGLIAQVRLLDSNESGQQREY